MRPEAMSEDEWAAEGYFVLPGAPVHSLGRYGEPLYHQSWVGVDEEIPF